PLKATVFGDCLAAHPRARGPHVKAPPSAPLVGLQQDLLARGQADPAPFRTDAALVDDAAANQEDVPADGVDAAQVGHASAAGIALEDQVAPGEELAVADVQGRKHQAVHVDGAA